MEDWVKTRFEFTGNDENVFKKLVEDITSHTEVVELDLKKSQFYYKMPEQPKEEEILCQIIGEGISTQFLAEKGNQLPKKPITKKMLEAHGVDFKEAKKTTSENFLILDKDGKLYFQSELAINSMNSRTRTDCTNFSRSSLTRTVAIREVVDSCKKYPLRFVIRTNDAKNGHTPFRKVFYVGSKFEYIPTTIIFRIKEKLEGLANDTLVLRNYLITQEYTEALYAFEHKSEEIAQTYQMLDAVPGILFQTSDIGKSSLYARAVWIINGRVVESSYVQKMHTSKFEEKEFLEECEKKLFKDYTVVPERLMTLMLLDITDMTLTTSQRKDEFEKLLKALFKEVSLDKCLSVSQRKDLKESLVREYNPQMPFSAYDLVERLLEIPDRIQSGISAGNMNVLRKSLEKIHFIDFASLIQAQKLKLKP